MFLGMVNSEGGWMFGVAAPLCDMIPAMAAAGPWGEAASTGLDGDSGAVSLVISGEATAEVD